MSDAASAALALSFNLQRVANVPQHPSPLTRLMSCARIANRRLPRIIGARSPPRGAGGSGGTDVHLRGDGCARPPPRCNVDASPEARTLPADGCRRVKAPNPGAPSSSLGGSAVCAGLCRVCRPVPLRATRRSLPPRAETLKTGSVQPRSAGVPPCATCAIWYNLCRASRWAAPLTACQCLKNNQRKSNASIVKYLNAGLGPGKDGAYHRHRAEHSHTSGAAHNH